jgi:hypothetical protein
MNHFQFAGAVTRVETPYDADRIFTDTRRRILV